MTISMTELMKSKFFAPSFDCAIYDDYLRIYYPQAVEERALEIYMKLQRYFSATERARGFFTRVHRSLLIFVYGSAENFKTAFPNRAGDVAIERLQNEVILGIRDVTAPDAFEKVVQAINQLVKQNSIEQKSRDQMRQFEL